MPFDIKGVRRSFIHSSTQFFTKPRLLPLKTHLFFKIKHNSGNRIGNLQIDIYLILIGGLKIKKARKH